MKKRILALMMAFILCLGHVPAVFAAEEKTVVYVTISDEGYIAKSNGKSMALVPVTVTDADEDGSLTVNDTLKLFHDEYCPGGYSTYQTDWGLSLGTLWGDSSGAFGYMLNDKSCWSLVDTVKNGDRLTAYIYKDQVNFSDTYTFFEKTTTCAEFELVLNKSGYDANWNPVAMLLTESEINSINFGVKATTDADFSFSGSNYCVNTSSSSVTFDLDNQTDYIVTAKSDTLNIVPAVYGFFNEETSDDNVGGEDDDNVPLYNKEDLFDIKEALVDYFIDKNKNKTPGDWAVLNLALSGDIDSILSDDETLQDYVNSTISSMDITNLSDCSRVLMALTSIGLDGSNLSQYRAFYDKNGNDVKNLVEDIENLLNDNKSDYITSKIYAYIALNCADYYADENTLSSLKDDILSCLDDSSTDPDSLFMAITSLWNENSEKAEGVFTDLVSSINENGTIGNANTTAWAVIAAKSLSIDADTIKHTNGKSLLDGILTFITADKTSGLNDNSSTNDMASRDVLTALICNDESGAFSPYDFSSTTEYDKTDWSTVTSIDIISKPEKTEYLKGEELDLTGLKIKVTLSDGTSFNIQGNDSRIKTSGFNSNTTGKKTVTISYGGIKKSFTVDVYSKYSDVYGEIWLKIFDPKGSTYYWSEDFFIEYGDTPISVLDKANIPYHSRETEYGTYIESIYNLGEGDKGPGSGWMVSVNGIFVNTSAENIILNDGDSVEWIYTRDFGKDLTDFGIDLFIPEKEIIPVEINKETVKEDIEKTIKQITESGTVTEWSAIGLALCDKNTDAFINSLVDKITASKGILSERKYTEYSKAILALTLNGIDASDVNGYDLTQNLEDFDKVNSQGINGTIWALIALDSGNYGSNSLREKYLNKIISSVKTNGGFGLGSGTDIDITAMAITALSNYTDREDVKKIVDGAVNYLSLTQGKDGGYTYWGDESSETTSQVIIALSALGIDITDERFVKEGLTLYDNLMSFSIKNGFKHTYADYKANTIATEQALLALISIIKGENIYTGSISSMPFDDIEFCPNKNAILVLYNKGILNGKGGKKFEPYSEMTRAEYITSIVTALGITPEWNAVFEDSSAGDWHFKFISAAYKAGLIVGDGSGKCMPDEKITAEQAAVIMAKAIDMKGKDSVNNTYYPVGDNISAWAIPFVEKCADNGIFDDIIFDAKSPVIRSYMAQMVYNLVAEDK